jgi:tetratricopeptide (TPR) repeat protein
MVAHSQFSSSSFKQVAKGVIALHQLIRKGKDDSPEADSWRDALDAPLRALSPIERERSQWLSEDLYSISEPLKDSVKNQPQAQQRINEAIEARQRREWDRALELLRNSKDDITPSLLSYLRGTIWMDAGNTDIASVFFGHSSEIDPANAIFRAMYMHALSDSDLNAAEILARDVLSESDKHAPIVVARAADIRYNKTKTSSGAESLRLCRELIPLLERTLSRIETDNDVAIPETVFGMTVKLLGLCHEFQGNFGTAIEYYTRGLQDDPNNEALLVARGTLSYGRGPSAISDFVHAIDLGSKQVWPYLFLAHNYLISNQFDRCRGMCETGLRMPASDSAKSQLEEWRAIALAELGFPPELVRSAFEEAVRLDSSNEFAQRNRNAFEALLNRTPSTVGSKWEQKSEVAIKQFGVAERLAEQRYTVAA